MLEQIENKIKELEVRKKVIKGLEWCMCEKHDCYIEKGCPYENEAEDIGCKYALNRDALALLKAQEPTQWHKDGCAKNSSVCIVDIGNDIPALLAAVVVNGRFIFDGLDITEKVRHWFAIPGIKADGQVVKWDD